MMEQADRRIRARRRYYNRQDHKPQIVLSSDAVKNPVHERSHRRPAADRFKSSTLRNYA